MVVGHSVSDQVFGTEQSLLEVLTAVDRQRFDVSCVFPSSNDAYLRAVAKLTKNITVFPYQWWTKTQPFDEETISRFETIFRCGRVDLVHVNTITLMDPLLAARRLDVLVLVAPSMCRCGGQERGHPPRWRNMNLAVSAGFGSTLSRASLT
jgi:hypothetical protein